MFEPLNFEELNETDVREEVVTPLIQALGYRSGTKHNVIREQSLRYPRSFLGRKNYKKDPILRGKADYILEADGRVRWVIEVKSPDTEIGKDEIEQAWTYANHPEVRAVYFVLCNGYQFQLFQTNQGPMVDPILSLPYEDLNRQAFFQQIQNILSPAAILRDHPLYNLDTGPPLGPGLRSVVRITNGLIRYEKNSLGIRFLNELQYGISEGALERDEKGQLVTYIHTTGPSRSLQELNERLKLAAFEMYCQDQELSANPQKPSVFVYDNTVILPAGEEILDLSTWKTIRLPMNIRCHVLANATGVLNEHQLSGTFVTKMDYINSGVKIDMSGSFYVHLS